MINYLRFRWMAVRWWWWWWSVLVLWWARDPAQDLVRAREMLQVKVVVSSLQTSEYNDWLKLPSGQVIRGQHSPSSFSMMHFSPSGLTNGHTRR